MIRNRNILTLFFVWGKQMIIYQYLWTDRNICFQKSWVLVKKDSIKRDRYRMWEIWNSRVIKKWKLKRWIEISIWCQAKVRCIQIFWIMIIFRKNIKTDCIRIVVITSGRIFFYEDSIFRLPFHHNRKSIHLINMNNQCIFLFEII